MSVKVPERPYPMLGEIYRGLAVALGTKNRNPDVDRMAREGDYDYRLRHRLLNELFEVPLTNQTNKPFSSFLCQFIDHLISEYIQLVNEVALDAMSREEALPLLVEHFFCRHAASLLVHTHKHFGGPHPVHYCSTNDNNVMKVACEWLEQNVDSFPNFFKCQDKAKQDQYRRWKQGKEIPKGESVTTFLEQFPESQDKHNIAIHLTVARAFQFYIKQYPKHDLPSFIQSAIWDVKPFDLGKLLSTANLDAAKKYSELQPTFIAVASALRRTTAKNATSRPESWALLEKFDKQISKIDSKGITRHFFEWQKARWYVFAGQYKDALKQYERAFDFTIYRAHYLSANQNTGQNLQGILKEALALAAKEKARPFMKRLKNQAIIFGINIQPGDSDKLSKANKKFKSHVVEEWEVEQWDTTFAHLFPTENCFPGCIEEQKHKLHVPFLQLVDEKHYLREPDLKNPNRKIDLGLKFGTEKRRPPQLVWHSNCAHPHHVKSLLDAGAKVDMLSDTSESALLFALIKTAESGDRRCFDTLKQHAHSYETMNIRTDKQKLTILLEAINTGQPDIVETILDMGAEVDRRGHTDDSTALNLCIKHIGSVKNLEKVVANMQNININDPVLIDSIRRSSNGVLGSTDREVRTSLEKLLKDKARTNIYKALIEAYIQQRSQMHEYKKLIEIANLLLERGADPNAVHSSPIPGYTPLMLAVELDEPELVQAMLNKSGDPYKTYQDGPYPIDCWRIAREFRSYSASRALEAHRRYS